MNKLYCVAALSLLALTACSSPDDSSAAKNGSRQGGAAPSAATVVVSKGNAFGSYVDDVNKAKALQRQSVEQSHPDLDKQVDGAPAAATANGP